MSEGSAMSDPSPGSVLDERTRLAGEPTPTVAPAPVPTTAEMRLPLEMEPQAQSEWCWAAVSASVARFFDAASTWSQCAVVCAELGQAGCCQDGGSAACNVPWQLTKGLQRVGHLSEDFSGALEVAAIAAQVEGGRPV